MIVFFKRKISAAFLITAIYLMIFSGCNEQPTELGYVFVRDTVSLNSITSSNVDMLGKSDSLLNRMTSFNVGNILVGKSNGIEAISLVRFGFFPDSLDWLTAGQIDSAFVEMLPVSYAFGDTSESRQFGFKVYEMKHLFTPETTWDSLFPGSGPSPEVDYSRELSARNGIMPFPNEDSIRIRLDIEKDYITKWFRMAADSNLKNLIYGLALIPDDNANVIRRFAAQAITGDDIFKTKLKVYYRGGPNEQDTVILDAANEATYANTDLELDPSQYITTQGLVSYFSTLEINTGNIPYFSGIHAAELRLKYAPEFSYFGTDGPDSVLVIQDADDPLYFRSTVSTPVFTSLGGFDPSTGDFVFTDITTFIGTWNRAHGGKGTLKILPSGANNLLRQLDRMVFYGPGHPDESKRPVLNIIYSSRPDDVCNEKE